MFIFAAVQHDCAVFLAVRVNQAMFFCLHYGQHFFVIIVNLGLLLFGDFGQHYVATTHIQQGVPKTQNNTRRQGVS